MWNSACRWFIFKKAKPLLVGNSVIVIFYIDFFDALLLTINYFGKKNSPVKRKQEINNLKTKYNMI